MIQVSCQFTLKLCICINQLSIIWACEFHRFGCCKLFLTLESMAVKIESSGSNSTVMMMILRSVYVELGVADDGGAFDPSTLDPNRCESCYGAETDDLKWEANALAGFAFPQFVIFAQPGVSSSYLCLVCAHVKVLQHLWWRAGGVPAARLGVQERWHHRAVQEGGLHAEDAGAEERRLPGLRLPGGQQGTKNFKLIKNLSLQDPRLHLDNINIFTYLTKNCNILIMSMSSAWKNMFSMYRLWYNPW